MSQVTANTTLELTSGGSVCDVRASVHFATAPAACHETVTPAGALAPAALRATTEYATWPAAADVATHVDVALLHPVHVNADGELLQAAVSVNALPTFGVLSDGVTTHTGTWPGTCVPIAHPGGTGPMRVNPIEPDAPLLEPPVKLKVSLALEQLWNTSVALPTATLCAVAADESKTPPVVA